MPMKYNFSKALINNIERTYTYSFAKNAYQVERSVNRYNPIEFFEHTLEYDPFEAFMNLDMFAFKKAKNTIISYGIPFTDEQERRAKVYSDVTEKMIKERSDYVSLFVDNLENTGVVLYKEPYILTTEKTIAVTEFIERLPRMKKTFNTIYKDQIHHHLINSKEQFEALKTCVENHIVCLIGGAGTGKSFVTANIVKQLVLNKKRVSVLAPTHKAREALQAKLEFGTVKTIHSFVHKPDPCDVIVIDESGMLSTPLVFSLMRVYDGQQLIFVGDKNQLPPIDYGRPFEKIQEIFTKVELKDNKRSESADIIALGREILGIPTNKNMVANNISVVDDITSAFEQGAEVVLSFTNADVRRANEERKVKNGDVTLSPLFSVGDAIIAKTNERDRFYNGQLFEIISYNKIRRKADGVEITLKNARDLEFNFDLAYGLTIHKSQGSEWDTVAYKPSDLDSANLAYVAVTRAKKKLIIVGDGMKDDYMQDRKWRQLDEVNSI